MPPRHREQAHSYKDFACLPRPQTRHRLWERACPRRRQPIQPKSNSHQSRSTIPQQPQHNSTPHPHSPPTASPTQNSTSSAPPHQPPPSPATNRKATRLPSSNNGKAAQSYRPQSPGQPDAPHEFARPHKYSKCPNPQHGNETPCQPPTTLACYSLRQIDARANAR